eukprot:1393030-Amorphochlora_amoeboformis.AAC.2
MGFPGARAYPTTSFVSPGRHSWNGVPPVPKGLKLNLPFALARQRREKSANSLSTPPLSLPSLHRHVTIRHVEVGRKAPRSQFDRARA